MNRYPQAALSPPGRVHPVFPTLTRRYPDTPIPSAVDPEAHTEKTAWRTYLHRNPWKGDGMTGAFFEVSSADGASMRCLVGLLCHPAQSSERTWREAVQMLFGILERAPLESELRPISFLEAEKHFCQMTRTIAYANGYVLVLR